MHLTHLDEVKLQTLALFLYVVQYKARQLMEATSFIMNVSGVVDCTLE